MAKASRQSCDYCAIGEISDFKTETPSSSDQFKRDVSTQTSSSLSYCSNAATQTTPTLPRFGHHPEHFNKNNSSEHSQNHPQMSERSLKHYLLNEQARFLDHCKKVGDSYWHPSDEDFDGEEYEGESLSNRLLRIHGLFDMPLRKFFRMDLIIRKFSTTASR